MLPLSVPEPDMGAVVPEPPVVVPLSLPEPAVEPLPDPEPPPELLSARARAGAAPRARAQTPASNQPLSLSRIGSLQGWSVPERP